MSTERADLINALRSLPDQLEALVSGLSPEELTTAYLASEWTVAQNVHHLFDSHANSYIRCKLIATEDRPPLKPYKQDDWAAMPDASEADITVSLALLRGLHTRWARFWEQLPEASWSRSGLHPEYGEMSLDGILRSYVKHGLGHLDQISRTLAAK
jgi:DinB superfamily